MTARQDFPNGTRVEFSPGKHGIVVGMGPRVYGGYPAQLVRVKPEGGGRIRQFPVARLTRVSNPATPKARRFVARKIRKLRREGKPERAAVGEALSIARRRGFRSLPKRGNPPPHHGQGVYSESRAWKFVVDHADTIAKAKALSGADVHSVRLLALQIRDLAKHMLFQVKEGVHINPRRKRNPVLGIIANESPAVFTVSKRVKEIVYIHSQDGEEYVHPFAPGVSATFLQDGRCVLWRRDGKPIGGRRIGATIRPIGG